MDGNPVAMIDPWGASTGSGEYVDQKTANSGSAAKGAKYKDNTGRVFQNRGEGLGWEEITPPAATANTPSNPAFRNDATQVVNRFIPDLARQEILNAQINSTETEGQNGFDINGYIYIDDNGKGDSNNNFASDGSSDGVMDLTDFADVIGSQSQGLNKFLSFLQSLFGPITESGMLENGDVEESSDEIKTVTSAEIEGIIPDLNFPRIGDREVIGNGEGGYSNWFEIKSLGGTTLTDVTGDSILLIFNGDSVLYVPVCKTPYLNRKKVSLTEKK